MKIRSRQFYMIGGAVLLLLLVIGIILLVNHLIPSKERMELSEYLSITEETQVAVTLDHQVYNVQGVLVDGHVYLDYNFVHDHINSRFYWDSNENILLYTTASKIISAKAESTSYYIGKSSIDNHRVVVKPTSDSALIDIDFVASYSNMSYTYYESPSRVVINRMQHDYEMGTIKKTVSLRTKAGNKNPILCDIDKKSQVAVIKTEKKWTYICTEDGICGYIPSKYIKDRKDITPSVNYKDEEFYHIKMKDPVNLLWHQVTSTNGNSKIAEIITTSKGVNVISPTWFQLEDNKGNILSFASMDYVNYCHSHGVQVWGLVSDLEKEVDTAYLLTHTSSRQNLVNQLVAVALQYNLDGINVDLEKMKADEVGDGYIQFIRELSIKCENNDLILSVDVPVPAPGNKFYHYKEQANFADYVIVMGYGEHWGQLSGEGSVSSLNWMKDAVENTLEEGVPSDQFILAMPFFTKLWNLTPTSNEENAEYIIGFENLNMEKAKAWMDANVEQPVWLEDCGQWYGATVQNNVLYKLWLEDTDSLEKRLELLEEYSLAGGAFWKSGMETKDVWDTIIKYIN